MENLIGIIVLTLQDYLRFKLSRSPGQPAAHCALCGRPASAVQRLIPGATGLAVCNECVLRCYAAITTDGYARGEHGGMTRFEAAEQDNDISC